MLRSVNLPVTEDGSKEAIILGKIAGVYGVKGWVKIISYSRPAENILQYPEWQLTAHDNKQVVVVEEGKQHGKGLIAKFAGLDDREQAKKLFGLEIIVARDELPELPDGEYYWQDLLGLRVNNENNEDLGEITEIHETGANDVLEVRGKQRYLIPLIYDMFVIKVNLDERQMVVAWESDEHA